MSGMLLAMPDGARLHVRRAGTGEPLVLVHGSWTDADSWAFVVPALEPRFDVVAYDRRGHTRSDRGTAPGGRRRDEDDLAHLVTELGVGPVHLVGSSYGGSIVLGLAARRPDLVRSVTVHEPPLVDVLDARAPAMAAEVRALTTSIVAELAAGRTERGTARFIEEVALGPGAWPLLPEEVRATFVANAPTFLEMLDDPAFGRIDGEGLAALDVPVLLSDGDGTVPWLRAITRELAASLPGAARWTFEGAGHAPHLSHPDDFVAVVAGALVG